MTRPARDRCDPAGRLGPDWRDRVAVPGRLPALCARDGVAELPDAGDGNFGRVISPVAGLAGDGCAPRARCSRIMSPASTGRRCRCSRERQGSTFLEFTTRSNKGWTRTQAERFHPALAARIGWAFPDAFLQEPWLWPEAQRLLGHRYPRADHRYRLCGPGSPGSLIWSDPPKLRVLPKRPGKIIERHASRSGNREGRRPVKKLAASPTCPCPFEPLDLQGAEHSYCTVIQQG